MASSPAVQLPDTSIDLYGASMVSTPRNAGNPQEGLLYDNAVLAAGAPVHFHPISPTKFLAVFSRIWSAATPSPTRLGFYTSYTESLLPSWFIADKTGWRGYVGSAPTIPVATPCDSIALRDACSRAPDYTYLLHTVSIGGVVSGLVQHFQVTVNGRIIPIAEEIVPTLSAPGVVFDKGIALTTPYLTVFGTDESGNLFMARKNWARVGTTVTQSNKNGTTLTPWQFSTNGGWSSDPTQAAPETGVTSDGPVSYQPWRKSTYLATTQITGSTVTAQVYTQWAGGPWKTFGAPVALGSTADGSYLGGTMAFQTMMGATPAMVNVPQAETAFPYVIATKNRVSGEDEISVNWGLLQIPRQV